MIEISIIIPVYNCEQYIEQCIRSIQNQTVRDLEIICINDGSSDESGTVLAALAKEDHRISVYEQKNMGAGAARNAGLKNAQGEFVAFMDADDYYKDMCALQKMIEKCKSYGANACGSIMNLLERGEEKRAANASEVIKMAQGGVMEYSEYPLDYDFTTFIFKRSKLQEGRICFPQYRFFEDPPFLAKALNCIGKYIMADVDLYCYRIVANGKPLSGEKCKDLLKGLTDNINLAIENHLDKLFEKTLDRIDFEYCNQICNQLSNCKAEGLELLLNLNHAVKKQDGYNNYMIRPLQVLFARNDSFQNNYKDNLIIQIQKASGIYIFGAGAMGRQLFDFLKKEGLATKVRGFLVSKKENNQAYIEGVPVLSISDATILTDDRILIAVSGLFMADIVKLLKEYRISNYEIFDPSLGLES